MRMKPYYFYGICIFVTIVVPLSDNVLFIGSDFSFRGYYVIGTMLRNKIIEVIVKLLQRREITLFLLIILFYLSLYILCIFIHNLMHIYPSENYLSRNL